jgi:hypothetical protein
MFETSTSLWYLSSHGHQESNRVLCSGTNIAGGGVTNNDTELGGFLDIYD